MKKTPEFVKRTKTYRKLDEYRNTRLNEVLHTTLNPKGPGVIRIHLVPPKPDPEFLSPRRQQAAVIHRCSSLV